MNIVLGSGNNRQVFEIATGKGMKAMAKESPIEHTKIVGNLKALVRRQPVRSFTKAAHAKMQAKNAAKRGFSSWAQKADKKPKENNQ